MRQIALALLAVAACCTLAATATESSSDHDRHGDGVIYSKDARPFGKSLSTWAELSLQWVYAQPFEHNPYFDTTGADCGVAQRGPVWYLATIAASAPGNYSRNCTVPRDKALLLQIGYFSDIYPCPDPNFKPAPNESLYHFLVADSEIYIREQFNFRRLDISLDGRPIRNAIDYRYISENLYAINGDPSLQPVFDGCITGSWQPAIVNGWFMMFRPLSRGMHTLVRSSTGPTGNVNTYTYYLNVR